MSELGESGSTGQSAATTTQSTGNSGAAATTTTSGGQASWRDSLPDDLKSNSALANVQDIPSLAKSYIHAQGLVGKKGVIVPTDKSTDEEWTSFYKAIGQPEADKFTIAAPEGKNVNENFMKGFKENALKAGMLPKQAQAMFDWYAKFESESMAARKTTSEQAEKDNIAALRKEWGAGYDKQINLAKMSLKDVGDPDFAEYVDKSGLGNDPHFIRFAAKVGALLGEDKLRGAAAGSFGKTPAEVQKSINAIRSNPKHPYFDNRHQGHKAANDEMAELMKQLHPV